ncbi:MAG: toll/interleukin-1 receptor domain-containing protein [Deltaproteobacteria bacterium]|nr:toll/interleukin-1 receptor domain-containing protein [Deltaproteobacteria bacterium]
MCPVWYDEYSLKVGYSPREQIEKGLKECKKCILILTPNYLTNEGWGKKEFDSVFTRELVEKQNIVLPVWHNVSVADIYQYSPSLADRVALHWSEGFEEVARKLKHAIETE